MPTRRCMTRMMRAARKRKPCFELSNRIKHFELAIVITSNHLAPASNYDMHYQHICADVVAPVSFHIGHGPPALKPATTPPRTRNHHHNKSDTSNTTRSCSKRTAAHTQPPRKRHSPLALKPQQPRRWWHRNTCTATAAQTTFTSLLDTSNEQTYAAPFSGASFRDNTTPFTTIPCIVSPQPAKLLECQTNYCSPRKRVFDGL